MADNKKSLWVVKPLYNLYWTNPP